MLNWACANCNSPLHYPDALTAEYQAINCNKCAFKHQINDQKIKYEPDHLLKKENHKLWRLWKVLNNNGYLSYLWLAEGSLSLSDRKDVKRFRDFIERHLRRGNILDIGCGILEVPGYLNFDDKKNIELIGLDPIGDSQFKGQLCIGVSEYLPLEDRSIDNVVFATSLDHVCLLDKSLIETRRVLNDDGNVFIWMGDRSSNMLSKIKVFSYKIIRHIVKPKRIIELMKLGSDFRSYQEYPNGVVFYIPKGAVDAFHRFKETPAYVTKAFKRNGFKLIEKKSDHKGEVFLIFKKS